VEAFHRLFAKDTTPLARRKAMLAQRRSVLDNALENARSLQRNLSKTDNAKLEEYFRDAAISDAYLAATKNGWACPTRTSTQRTRPDISGYEEIRLMYAIMVAALQTDSTQVLTS